MLTAARFQQHCAQLVDPSITPEARKDLATAVRDSMELVHSQEYASFLTNFLPTFRTVLTDLTKPQQVDNTIHQTRAVILEILNRLPHNDILKGRFLEVFALAMETLQKDNEENAVTAIHIIFDLHKNYRHHLASQVQTFLDFVRHLYQSFASTVKSLLQVKKPAEPSGQGRRMATSTQSFKVMTECPLLVMFVFQLYPAFIKTNIQHLLPLMLRAIEVEVPAQAMTLAPRSTFQEFIAAQVKTVSFLAYLLKQFPDLMKSDEMSIPRSVVKLLQSCPGESVLIRKELLVATRHILGSPFRQGFYGQIDLLLEPRILVGSGRGAADTLRPLAYSFLAELVHCVRLSLSIPQLEKIINIFSTNLHDPTFTYTLQTSAVRLLLNLIEGILKVDNGDSSRNSAARELLLRILETMVAKYVTLGEQVPRLLKSVEELRARPDPVSSGTRLCEVVVGDPMKEITDFKTLLKTLTLGLKTVIWSAINIRVSQVGSTKGRSTGNSLERTGEAFAISMAQRPGTRAGLLEKECEMVSKLLSAGQKCFDLYRQREEGNLVSVDSSDSKTQTTDTGTTDTGDADSPDKRESPQSIVESAFQGSLPRLVIASTQEEKEMFDLFAQIFTVLDIRSFQDVFGLRMADLFDHIVGNPTALMIPQHFLANSSISKYFADILLNFLVDNLQILDVAIPKTATSLTKEETVAQSFLKLFKTLFASVTLFPTNEPILRLHIGTIVRKCLKQAAKARDPHNYLQMLRALFKTLTNNKTELQFDLLYRDFMPLVEPLFTGLLSLYQGSNRQAHSELIVELCLMIPARPSTIFPYLDLQIKPIVWALEGGRENVQYGLRTLEFWVDMLQPGYLETLIARVEPDLTRSLYRLLRPPSSSAFGATALRILGKLGSRARNRTALKMSIGRNSEMEPLQRIGLKWVDGSELFLEADAIIRLSADALLGDRPLGTDQATSQHKCAAWKFLYACLSPILRATMQSKSCGAEEESTVKNAWVVDISKRVKSPAAVRTDNLSKRRRVQNKEPKAKQVKHMLMALVGGSGSKSLQALATEESSGFWNGRTPVRSVSDIARIFALMTAQESERKLRSLPSTPESTEELNPVLHHTVFLDAIVDVIALEDRDLCRGGLSALKAYLNGILEFCICSSSERVEGGPIPDTRDVPVKRENIGEKKPEAKSVASKAVAGDMDIDSGKGVPIASGDRTKGTHRVNAAGPQTAKRPRTTSALFPYPKDEQVLAIALSGAVERLCHFCFRRTWNTKWAGAKGLEIIINQIPSRVLRSHHLAGVHLQIFRALLFVIRDSSGAIEEETFEKGRSILYKLMRICFQRKDDDVASSKAASQTFSKVLRDATIRLTVDLTSESSNARETAQEGLRILAEVLGCDVAQILTPVKDHILRPLQQRPIRQHPFPVQVAHIDATIFCLEQERPLLGIELFSEPLRNVLLKEVIAISEDSTVEKLTEAEEGIRHRLVENKLIQTVVVKHLVHLRRKAVELLCRTAVHCSKFLQEAANDDLFRRIISSFFKNLQSRDAEIVESAKRGLKQAIAKHQKPKELLQQNLRPILANLADYKKLSIQYLQGLSRVLELFSHWFNVNLGEKLLEHLQRWTEPEKLAQLKRWPVGTEARVGAAILDLFHLLPPAASRFLDKIVRMVISLESVLSVAGPGVAHLGLKSAKAASTSPYREPLMKYCNGHAKSAAEYFISNLDDEMMRQLFFVMVRAKESGALLKELMDNPKLLVAPPFLSVEGMGAKNLHVISLIDLLSRHKPEWLGTDPDLMAKLTVYWKTASNFSEAHLSAAAAQGRVREVKIIADILIRYLSHFPKEINTLFDLLPVFSVRTSCDFTFVKDFLKESVTVAGLCTSRRQVIAKFLSLFQEKHISQERKVHALQYIVTPMISFHLSERRENKGMDKAINRKDAPRDNRKQDIMQTELNRHSVSGKSASTQGTRASPSPASRTDLTKPNLMPIDSQSTLESAGRSSSTMNAAPREKGDGTDLQRTSSPDVVLDATMVQRIMKDLLDQPDEILRKYDEPLSAELLRLATLLIRYMPTELGRYRKELIKFGWNHLKREDSIAKQWAFVNVSRFFEAYQAPVKIILQVYVALLRACQGDGKELVQQALDVLTPALPRRLEHNPDDHKYPIWIRYTKKILLEEGHSIPNLVHIWQLIARHPSLFYVARAQFVPIMVNSLSRIGLNSTTNPENRRLSLDLVELIIRWERTRRSKSSGHSAAAEVNMLGPNNSSKKRGREEGEPPTTAPGTVVATEPGTSKKDFTSEPPAKIRKSSDGEPVPAALAPNRSTVPLSNREAEDFKPTMAMVDILVNFLVQLPFRPMDRREGPLITKKSLLLLTEAIEMWPDATIRLGFVEKLLGSVPGEKVRSAPNAAPGNKSAPNHANGDANTTDQKGAQKNEAQRADKEEQVRLKRNAVRFASLTTALMLSNVLTKTQGKKFVLANLPAIRSLVLPSITENVVQTATQFASLLKNLLAVCPSPDGATTAGTQMSVPVAKDTGKKPEAEIGKAANPVQEPRSTRIADVYIAVHEAIQACMKAPDAVANQCGLVVLKTFSSSAPQEFMKYQEVLTKSLHRMTKENLSSSQPAASGGTSSTAAGGSVAHRSGNATERISSSAVTSNASRSTGANNGTGLDSNQASEVRGGRSQGVEELSQKAVETQALILCISLLGDNITSLESGQRKTLFHLLWALIDRSLQVEILLEIVRVVGNWVLWKPKKDKGPTSQKEPLTSKEKVHFLLKMVVFERISGKGSHELMSAYLKIILKIFGGDEKRPELLPKLERSFMLGLKAQDARTRREFFQIYDQSLPASLPIRLGYVLAKQDWEYLADTLWIKQALEFMLAAVDKTFDLRSDEKTPVFPLLTKAEVSIKDELGKQSGLDGRGRKIRTAEQIVVSDDTVVQFCASQKACKTGTFVDALCVLLHHDAEVAYQAWVDILPKAWSVLSPVDRPNLEKAIPQLLTKEYHQFQATWPRNNIQALLDAVLRCEPLPLLKSELVFHLGSRWNAWHSALRYLEKREYALSQSVAKKSGSSSSHDSPSSKIKAEREDIYDAHAMLYRQLHERDYLAGLWKARARSHLTSNALNCEQLGQYANAQDFYAQAIKGQVAVVGSNYVFGNDNKPGKAESCFWEERWIECARNLCQWDVLTEFSRVVVNSELLHECLWRVPDWSALKELLIKNPVEDGPQLKLYQAYVQLQENKLELADSFIMQGYQRALERYCALPDSADLDASAKTLVQFQQLVELQESGRILGELNALSRHGSGSINVDQKIDNVRLILNTWRERLPSQHEPLSVWNDILTWRNHVHAVVVNVLEALKEAASAKVAAAQNSSTVVGGTRNHANAVNPQTPQVQAAAAIAQALPQQVLVMGVNETAWNVHRFAKACRKQGFPDMALYALQKLYPFGTMELTEYFVKTKETARSFMSYPKGLDNSTEHGLHELNRCNMDHFNARQKAQLFTIRGKLCVALGRDDDAIDAYSIALSTSSDVGSAWLAWGLHCDKHQAKLLPPARLVEGKLPSSDEGESNDSLDAGLEWREAAVNCLLQAVRFGSRKSRTYLPRVLRLLTLDVQTRITRAMGKDGIGVGNVSKDSGSSNGQGSAKDESGSKPSRDKNRTSENLSTMMQSISGQGVANVMTKLVADIPVWMWLPWLHQLVLMLGRREAVFIRPILVRLAQEYPQAVFFPIRAFMEERKAIDRPDVNRTIEALKMDRPMTPALLPTASAVQATAARQTQVVKENVHRAQHRYLLVQKALQRIEAALASSQGTPEHAAQLTKKSQLKEEQLNAHRLVEKCVREYQAAQQRQRQIAENPANVQPSTAGSRMQIDATAKKGVHGPSENVTANNPNAADRKKTAAGNASKQGEAGTRVGSGLTVSSGSKNPKSTSNVNRSAPGFADHPFAHADFVMSHIVKSHQLLYLELDRVAIDLSYGLKPRQEEHLLSLMNALLHRCYQHSVKAGREVAPSFRSALEDVSRMCFGTGVNETREKITEQRQSSSVADLRSQFEAELAPQTASNFPTQVEPFIERLRRWQGIFQRRVDAMPEFLKLENLSRTLTEFSTSDVEIFGQYFDAEVSEPNCEQHVKIARFSADVRVIRRQSGSSRGVEIIGSDGKSHHFVLETSVGSNAQATEDRTAQIYRLFNAFIFTKNAEAHQRLVRLTVPTFVATGARTRLMSDDPSHSTLAEGLESFLLQREETIDDPLMAFRTIASEAYGRRRAESVEQNAEHKGRAESIAARVEAYHALCRSRVPDSCLLEWVKAKMPTATRDFIFRKRVAETLGPASLVSYALAIGARRPQNIMFSWSTGAVSNLHMRGLISKRGVLESDEAVPFRLTRNLRRLLGPFGVEGPFYGSMAAAMQALLQQEDLVRLFLDIVIRDELSSSMVLKSDGGRRTSGEKDKATMMREFALLERRLSASVDAVVRRLGADGGGGGNAQQGRDQSNMGIANAVHELISKAIQPENLAQMEASWQAWY